MMSFKMPRHFPLSCNTFRLTIYSTLSVSFDLLILVLALHNLKAHMDSAHFFLLSFNLYVPSCVLLVAICEEGRPAGASLLHEAWSHSCHSLATFPFPNHCQLQRSKDAEEIRNCGLGGDIMTND